MYPDFVPMSICGTLSFSEPSDIEWHPLSYYISGGLDLDGSNTRLDAHPLYDGNSDESPEVYTSPDVLGQPFFDPRISPFDIAEIHGAASYREAQEQFSRPKDETQTAERTAE